MIENVSVNTKVFAIDYETIYTNDVGFLFEEGIKVEIRLNDNCKLLNFKV